METITYTASQLVDHIKAKHPLKYYEFAKPRINASTAHRICEAIKDGTCKPDTERKFFKAFGFDVAAEVTYMPTIQFQIKQI